MTVSHGSSIAIRPSVEKGFRRPIVSDANKFTFQFGYFQPKSGQAVERLHSGIDRHSSRGERRSSGLFKNCPEMSVASEDRTQSHLGKVSRRRTGWLATQC
jgi:hypothetical protein